MERVFIQRQEAEHLSTTGSIASGTPSTSSAWSVTNRPATSSAFPACHVTIFIFVYEASKRETESNAHSSDDMNNSHNDTINK